MASRMIKTLSTQTAWQLRLRVVDHRSAGDRHPALPDVQRRPLGGEIDVGPPPVTRGVGPNIMSDRRRGTGARRREGDEGGRVAPNTRPPCPNGVLRLSITSKHAIDT
jgi:hypothetical protein